MKIYVDADACPVVRIVENLAKKYEVPCTLLCDTNHILTSDYSEGIMVLRQWPLGKGVLQSIRVANGTRMKDDERFAESFEKIIRKAKEEGYETEKH